MGYSKEDIIKYVPILKDKLKNESIDTWEKEKAIECLKKCVLPKPMIAIFLEHIYNPKIIRCSHCDTLEKYPDEYKGLLYVDRVYLEDRYVCSKCEWTQK